MDCCRLPRRSSCLFEPEAADPTSLLCWTCPSCRSSSTKNCIAKPLIMFPCGVNNIWNANSLKAYGKLTSGRANMCWQVEHMTLSQRWSTFGRCFGGDAKFECHAGPQLCACQVGRGIAMPAARSSLGSDGERLEWFSQHSRAHCVHWKAQY